jgi:hypothetical protein
MPLPRQHAGYFSLCLQLLIAEMIAFAALVNNITAGCGVQTVSGKFSGP